MIQPSLLALLACPESHQPLRLATTGELEKIRALAGSSALKDVSGEPLPSRIDGALIREDGKLAYRIDEGIPILLVEQGFELSL